MTQLLPEPSELCNSELDVWYAMAINTAVSLSFCSSVVAQIYERLNDFLTVVF